MNEGIIDFDKETGQIVLRHEDGTESRFYIECEIEVEEKTFIVLVPADEFESEDEEVTGVVFQIGKDDDGEQVWMGVEDEKMLEKIEKAMAEIEEEEEEEEEE